MTSVIDLNKEEKIKFTFLEAHDCFIFDCDGVLWKGDEVISGVPETLKKLKEMGKKILFVSNNSTKSRQEYLTKFKKLGIEATEEQIISSAYSTAYYLKNRFKKEKREFEKNKVFVIGQNGVKTELQNVGIKIEFLEDDHSHYDHNEFVNTKLNPEISAVVVGLDRNVSYLKLAHAHAYLQRPDVLFIATNTDLTFPMEGGKFAPGTGALVKVVEVSSGREPIVMGKPSQPMLDCAIDKFDLDIHRTCMVGDRLDTDILFGNKAGMSSLLVFTGVVQADEVDNNKFDIYPTHTINSVVDFFG